MGRIYLVREKKAAEKSLDVETAGLEKEEDGVCRWKWRSRWVVVETGKACIAGA